MGHTDASHIAVKVDEIDFTFDVSLKDISVAPDFESPDCYCMFASILEHFLTLAEKYPWCIWYSDQVFGYQPLEGVEAIPQGESDEEEEPVKDGPIRFIPEGLHGIRQGRGFIIPIRDFPKTHVDSYMQAMKLHLQNLEVGDKLRANAWFQVAMQFPEAPKIKDREGL